MINIAKTVVVYSTKRGPSGRRRIRSITAIKIWPPSKHRHRQHVQDRQIDVEHDQKLKARR